MGRERMRLAAVWKSKHPEFWPQDIRSLWKVQRSADSNEPDISSLWVWICGLLVAATMENCPIWNHRWQGSSTLSCMMKQDEMKEPLRRACSRTPVMERYTMSSQVGGNVGRVEGVENELMQYTMENFTHTQTQWKFNLWGSNSTAHGCHGPYCLQIEQCLWKWCDQVHTFLPASVLLILLYNFLTVPLHQLQLHTLRI